MSILRDTVNQFTNQERLQIVAEHARLERDGFIGDSLLRTTAHKLTERFDGYAGGTSLWMDAVATAVYRHFAERFIATMDDGR